MTKSQLKSKVETSWIDGPDLNRVPHEHLMAEDYYESNSVSAGRSTYTCEHCGNTIPSGGPSVVHKFYGDGDWPSYRTHVKCSDKFMDSLRTEADGPPEY